ncbi:MAG: AAA family ATPase [Caulobacteraceae bacterium]|nr:AAA family ATPase [Caulobacteraceae bacterium]
MNWFYRIYDWVLGLFDRSPATSPEPEYVWRPAAAEPAPVAIPEGAYPRFMASAGDQTALPDAFAAIRAKLRQAYTPAQPVTDRKMFSGRSRVLGSVIQAIEDQRLHTVIYGERGLGKTSTLHVLAQTARDARYLVLYHTCSASSNFDDVFRAVCAGIPLMFHADHGPTSQQTERGDNFASILGTEPVTTRVVGELFGKVVGTRILVILDEFDRAENEEYRRNIAELIKSLSDRAARVQLLIGGVAANLSELIANVPSIQRNIFALQLPKMPPSEIRDLVKNGESISGLTFDDDAVETITAKSLGFPFLATLLSQRSALTAIDSGRVEVTAQDVEEAVGEVIEEFRGRVSRRSVSRIEACAAEGALPALGALAGAAQTVGGWFSPFDLAPIHGDPATLSKAKANLDNLLANSGLLETRGEGADRTYHFAEESVPPYLWLVAGHAHADASFAHRIAGAEA